ncbi:Lrp/AsnC family transcriptional regulator [Arenivirga flava]|uniref:Transcriptional regulator, AsnC family protein n=1 Tax=Arenivirga flava TaxID=1930060 RepID=A0AA37UM74_9MICO|nr:Lrp/AsnC family transcriptional regulator [Arenivirga flava]GMA29501.1 putative transcriptional regulator, AsnC family protein [Arenivirga flava]
MRNATTFDGIDHAIIERLSQDGRLSNTELARSVGLTPAPCLRRVQRLERDGVISGYRAVIDPVAAGRGFEVIVSVEITLSDAQTVAEFETAVIAFDEVVEARRLLGVPDYFLRINVADVNAFERFTMEKLTRLPAVSRVISHQTMRVLKSLA